MLKSLLESQSDIPWDALRFVTGSINYGGRVTDERDRRCLLAILSKLCNTDILSPNHPYSQSGIYHQPEASNLLGYQDYIKTLPDEDHPEIFGMHQNANINF